MWQHVVNNKDLKGLAMLSLFLYGRIIEMSFDGEQKMGIWLVLLRWGPIYSIMNISVFGGVLWI